MWITRLVLKAKVAMVKVKWMVAPMIRMVEGIKVRPSITQEGVPTLSEICLLGMDRCLSFIDDFIPRKSRRRHLRDLLKRVHNGSSRLPCW